MGNGWVDFCGGKLLDNPYPTGLPNVSTCMQHSILIWVPFTFCAILLPFFLAQAKLTSRRFQTLPWGFHIIAKIIICLLALAANVFILAHNIATPHYTVDVLYPALLIAIFGISIVMHLIRKRSGMVTSGIQHLTAVLLLVCGGPEVYQKCRDLHENRQPSMAGSVVFLAYYSFLVIYTILMSFADKRSPEEKAQRSVELDSSFLNRLTLWWYNPVPWIGARRDLEIDDVFELNEGSTTPFLSALWESNWNPRLEKYRIWQKENSHILNDKPVDKKIKEPLPSVVINLFAMFKWEILVATFLKLCSDTLQFANPFLLHQVISFVSDADTPLWVGLSYALLMLVASEIRSFLINSYFYIMFRIGIKFQTALTAAVYKKTLTLSNSARKDKTVGEIVNLMAIDIERFQMLTPQIQQYWSCPYQITLALIYLYFTLGYSAAPGIVIMIIFVPLNIVSSMIVKKWQTEQMKLKDRRTKMVNEVLNGMKVVKLYAWEMPLEDHIDEIRQKELNLIKKSAMVRNVLDSFNTASPFLVALFSFGTYVLSSNSHELTPQIAFVSLTLFNQLRSPMSIIAFLINQTVQVYVSNIRLKSFFVAEELDPNVVDKSETKANGDAINVSDLSATWGENDKPTLRDITIGIKKGNLLAVVGSVGAGKSSLLSSLLGEMGKLRGRIGVNGTLAYVPQQAWIQNMTVRDNILFGKPFDRQRYNQVLYACALKSDLKILPLGDMTEIGEKGINLSGGQKARVSLARAVYQDYDVYLLDDPLSAVDSHVGKHIYEKVIGPQGMLRNKTRILVTHGLTFLKTADEIIVLEDGSIVESGGYQELITKKGVFYDFVEEYKSNAEKDESEENSEDDIEEADLAGKDDVISEEDRRMSAMSPDGVGLQQMKSVEPTEEKKLIQKEGVASGGVKLAVYKMYITAATKWRSLLLILLFITYQVFQVLRNFWLSAWSDEYDPDEHEKHVAKGWRLGIYGLLGTIESISFLMALMMMVYAGLSASRNLHWPLIHNLMRSPMEFYDTTPLGRILNRCAKDVDVVDMQLPMNFRYLIMCVLQVFTTLIVIIISTPLFAVVVIPLAVIYYFFLRFYVPTSRQLKRLESINRSPIYSHFGETVQGAAFIRAFGKVEEFRMSFGRIVDRFIRCKYSNIVSNRWLAVRLEFIGNCVVFFATLFAVLGKQFGWSDSPGIVGVSISYALSITDVLNFALRQISEIEANIVAVERIDEYTHTPNEAEWRMEDHKPAKDWPAEGKVKFDNYSTRYRAGLDLVLNGIDADVTAGEKIGIVGRTGAGKSSFALALFRMIEPAGGSIVIDGVDVNKIGLHDLRSGLTIIPQDPVLFSGTLRFNLDPFSKCTDDEIWHSLELAHLKEFVSTLNGGLQYSISEGGENISVGQRQLVCLARALLRRTRILVLDEATAAVDVTTDALIQATIREQFKQSSVFTIAHRLNTILDYDRIMVLDKGQIVEFDTPSTLLDNKNSVFAKMVADSQNDEK